MTYQEMFTSAKTQARDILRIQMAGRVQERVSQAKTTLISAIKTLADLIVRWDKIEARDAKSKTEQKEHADAIRKTIGTMPEADRTLALEALDNEMAEESKHDTRIAEQRAKDRAADIKRLEDGISIARAEYERLLAVQKEVEDGTQKVNKDELISLANKLVEEGRVNAAANYQ